MKLSHILPPLLLSLAALPALAADPEAGHALVHKHCTSCHHNEVYRLVLRLACRTAGKQSRDDLGASNLYPAVYQRQ